MKIIIQNSIVVNKILIIKLQENKIWQNLEILSYIIN